MNPFSPSPPPQQQHQHLSPHAHTTRSPRRSTTVVNSTTVVAPPLVGGYGFGMPFFGGYGFGMPMFMPIPIFGGLLQLMFLLVIANVVFSIVKGAVNAAGKAGKKDDDWDSL